MGGFLFVWTVVSIWFFVDASIDDGHTDYGQPPCRIIFDHYYYIEVLISTILYYTETTSILSLYVYKYSNSEILLQTKKLWQLRMNIE